MLRFIFFTIITIITVGLILYYLVKSKDNELSLIIALALILGGALGNLLDRIRFGEVIDFIDVFVKTYHWPAFNIADSAISLGAFLMFFWVFRRGKKDKCEG